MERRRPTADGISRLLSALAIVLSLVGAVFLYGENQKLKKEVASFSTESAGTALDSKFAEQTKKWDAEIKQAIDKFAGDATDSLEKFDAAREARDDLYAAAIQASETRAEAVVRDYLKSEMVAMKPISKPAKLQLAHTVVKPIDGEDVPVRIANDGDLDASIVAVRFVPIARSQFQTDLPPVPEADQIVIRFSSQHNNATKANHHKLYQRSYDMLAQRVAANDTVEVSVEIARTENVGWGMKGNLELEYDDEQTLTIPAINAIFVPEKVDT